MSFVFRVSGFAFLNSYAHDSIVKYLYSVNIEFPTPSRQDFFVANIFVLRNTSDLSP